MKNNNYTFSGLSKVSDPSKLVERPYRKDKSGSLQDLSGTGMETEDWEDRFLDCWKTKPTWKQVESFIREELQKAREEGVKEGSKYMGKMKREIYQMAYDEGKREMLENVALTLKITFDDFENVSYREIFKILQEMNNDLKSTLRTKEEDA